MKQTCCECTADGDVQEEESRNGDVHDDDNKETMMIMRQWYS
jgi:hypothetical protein